AMRSECGFQDGSSIREILQQKRRNSAICLFEIGHKDCVNYLKAFLVKCAPNRVKECKWHIHPKVPASLGQLYGQFSHLAWDLLHALLNFSKALGSSFI